MRFFVYLFTLFHFFYLSTATLAAKQDTLVFSWTTNVGPLNPHLYSPNQMFAQAMVYESLVRYGDGGEIQPWLATSWEISRDGRVYTFFLRKDVTFSDGTPFDSNAVKMNFDAVLKNRTRHGWLELISQIEKTEVVDPHTFRMYFKKSYYPVLQELSLVRPVRFLSPKSFPEDLNTSKGISSPVGTGPWRLVESKKGEYDLFERNDTYWGTKPKFKKLLVKVISDTNARAIAFDTGEIDLIYGSGGHGSAQISLDDFVRYTKNPNLVTAISDAMATRVVDINTNRAPTSDIAVRKAILHAINKEALINYIFLGTEKKADTLFSPDVPYCNLNLKPYGYDPDLAGRILDKNGWTKKNGTPYRLKDGKELVLEFCFTGNDALQKSIAEAIQGDLKNIGIKVKLVGEEADSFHARQKNGEFGMIFGNTWGAPYDPHSFCSSMRVPSHADYQAQLGLSMKKELDEKIDRVLTSVDAAERQNLYRDILTTLHQEAVYLPISYMTGIMAHRKTLHGAHFGPTKYDIPFVDMYRE